MEHQKQDIITLILRRRMMAGTNSMINGYKNLMLTSSKIKPLEDLKTRSTSRTSKDVKMLIYSSINARRITLIINKLPI
jgi:hypothetical protein